MKKVIRLIVCTLILCTLFIPNTICAASNDKVAEDLKNWKFTADVHYQNYLDSIAIEIPVEKNDVLINSLMVTVGLETVSLVSVADILSLKGHENDGFVVVPKEESYIEDINASFKQNMPFFDVTKRLNDSSAEYHLDVILSNVNDSFYKVFQQNLISLLNKEKAKMLSAYTNAFASIMTHGGNTDDKKELDAIYNEFLEKLEKVNKEKSDLIKKMHDNYMAKGNNALGFILSEGNKTIVVGVACSFIGIVVGYAAATFINKKKKPALKN